MTHIYGNAVPVQKYLRERRSHAFPHHYTTDCVILHLSNPTKFGGGTGW